MTGPMTNDVRQVVERIANWPDVEMFTSLSPAHAMRALAREALGMLATCPKCYSSNRDAEGCDNAFHDEPVAAQPSEVERLRPSTIALLAELRSTAIGGPSRERAMEIAEALATCAEDADEEWSAKHLDMLAAQRRAEKAEADVERVRAELATSERKRKSLIEGIDKIAPGYRLASEELHAFAARVADELNLPKPEDQGGHPFTHTPHSLIAALRDKVKALTAQPAPSGWQQRIAAMEPWVIGLCHFCGCKQYRLVVDELVEIENPHASDCLWQNAVDAGQPAKDAIPPAPPAAKFDEPIATDRDYRCSRCGYECIVNADTHEPMLCFRTNCGGMLSPVALPPVSEASPAKETR